MICSDPQASSFTSWQARNTQIGGYVIDLENDCKDFQLMLVKNFLIENYFKQHLF
jgi:hypothetical protein